MAAFEPACGLPLFEASFMTCPPGAASQRTLSSSKADDTAPVLYVSKVCQQPLASGDGVAVWRFRGAKRDSDSLPHGTPLARVPYGLGYVAGKGERHAF